MYIKRYYDELEKCFDPKRVLVIYGPRRVGKTTLLNSMTERLEATGLKVKKDNGGNIQTQNILSSQDFPSIEDYMRPNDVLTIDEAQYIPNIGMGLKILIDQFPDRKIAVTGSSSFDLASNLTEPLTGRKTLVALYPIAQLELLPVMGRYDLKLKLEDFLIYGSYPEVLTAATTQEKIEKLEELANSYLFKDILSLEGRQGSSFILTLARMLALQVGCEVSVNELATALGANRRTIERYLDLLEQTFVVFKVGSYSRNLRSELVRKQKYYFYDNGVRNAIIGQFNALHSRNDVGALWENFIVAERLKKRSYHKIYGSSYFWRTHSQKEIDIIEERDGQLFAFECKWSQRKEIKPPREWTANYPDAEFTVITPENYLDFVT